MAQWLAALTYNVRLDTPDDGEHAWDHRRESVASTIRFHYPDVIGLQEPLDHQLAFLIDQLPDYEWVGESRGEGENEGEHTPIGFRADRFECRETNTFWLSETPDSPGSVGWDASHPRIVTWVRLADRTTGSTYVHANTHFSHEGARARTKSARLVLDRLTDIADSDPIVLSGDFNFVAGDPAFEILTGDGGKTSPLASASERSPHPPHGPDTTVTDFESLVPDQKIDHVFVTDSVAVGQYGVCCDCYADGRFPSDHLPILVKLAPGAD